MADAQVRGFTLVEVLVALSLSALVAVLAYESLSVASNASGSTETLATEMDRVDLTWQFLRQDLSYAIARQPLKQQQSPGRELPAFEAVGDAEQDYVEFVGDSWLLRLTRSGWQNPLQQLRSELQGVGYQLVNGELYRVSWPVRDYHGELESQMQKRLLLEGVEGLSMRFLPAGAKALTDSAWQTAWPGDRDAKESLPLAVEVTITLPSFGEVTRSFLLEQSQ